ncbi:MAG: hypothetical protein IKL79_01190 [Clostridia bacterium]|nr:hypothetical protein [Clostridia bacterium]
MVKDVTSKKFNAIMSKKIYLHKCPKCPNLGGEIIIPMTTYGAKTDRVYIRCKYCGYETKCYDASTMLNDTESSRFGSPVIDKSLIKAIHNAVNDWNRRSKNGT